MIIHDAVQKLQPGDTLTIPAGLYKENIHMENINGTADAPIRIVANSEVTIDGGGETHAFAVVNCAHIHIEGLRVTNAHHGIDVKSTPARGDVPMDGIVIKGNKVYGIDGPRGGHAIAVYGENPNAPIGDLRIEGNEVHDNKLYWSEALVVNGNIDGFVICNNVVWNNDNIGIDIIGFEGKAGDNPDVDCARNGKVYENIVFGSDTTGNEAYWSGNHNPEGWDGERRAKNAFGGEYDRCCGGIYVDGGWHIEIYHNFIFDNDLGIEVATEHKPPLVTKDVHVYENIICSSTGWAGLIFGGYASHLGFTEDCTFVNNILYGNDTQIAVQKSHRNAVQGNVIVGGWEAIDFNGDMAANNAFMENLWENTEGADDYFDQLETLTGAQRPAQLRSTGLLKNPENGDFTMNAPEGYGTTWRPADKYLQLYAEYLRAQEKANAAMEFLQSKSFAAASDDVCANLTKILHENGHADAQVARVFKSAEDKHMVQVIVRYGAGGFAFAQATTKEGVQVTAHVATP
ncbi:MAG: hypothetical protein FWC71_05370 [Defluviitaleaceae bacterium]|nr:hypothetical protein [Defluviitaleaceae bacterium]